MIQIWFASARQQLTGVVDACLYVKDSTKEALTLVESTSKTFSQSKQVVENLQAAVQRRKSIVTAVNSISQNQAVASNAGSLNVTDITSKNYLVAAPLIINKEIVGVVCFEFTHDKHLPSQDYLS